MVTDLGGCHELPDLVAVEGGNLHTAGEEVAAGLFDDLVQRTLDTVVDRADQSGSEFDGKRYLHGFNGLAGAEALRFLIDLNGSFVSVHFDDLADQTLLADTDNVKHVGVAHAFRNDQRAGYFFNSSNAHGS